MKPANAKRYSICNQCRRTMEGLVRSCTVHKVPPSKLWTFLETDRTCQMCHVKMNVSGRNKSMGSRSVVVDHDHACCPGDRSCGACVRGIICHSCNSALGRYESVVHQLDAITSYLKLAPLGWAGGSETS